jgi:hypothetical protein
MIIMLSSQNWNASKASDKYLENWDNFLIEIGALPSEKSKC